MELQLAMPTLVAPGGQGGCVCEALRLCQSATAIKLMARRKEWQGTRQICRPDKPERASGRRFIQETLSGRKARGKEAGGMGLQAQGSLCSRPRGLARGRHTSSCREQQPQTRAPATDRPTDGSHESLRQKSTSHPPPTFPKWRQRRPFRAPHHPREA